MDWSTSDCGAWVFRARQRAQVWQAMVRRWGYGNPWPLAAMYERWAQLATGATTLDRGRSGVIVRHPALTRPAGSLLSRFELSPEDHHRYWSRFIQLAGAEVGVRCEWQVTDTQVQVHFTASPAAPAYLPVSRPADEAAPTQRALITVAHHLGVLLGSAMSRGFTPEQVGRFLVTRALPCGFHRRRANARPTAVQGLLALACRQHLGLSNWVRVQRLGRQWVIKAQPLPADTRVILGVYDVLPAHVARLYNALLQVPADEFSMLIFCEAGEQTFQTELRPRTGVPNP